jgi:hypothetical protein
MTRKKKIGLALVLLVAAGGLVFAYLRFGRRRSIVLQGAVVQQDSDSRKELPIPDVRVTVVTGGSLANETKTDSAGFFTFRLYPWLRHGRPITLSFVSPDYQPLTVNEFISDKLYVARLVPKAHPVPVPDHPEEVIGNIVVRYSMKTASALNVGSAVKTFQVENTGNVRCNGRPPCSPDGRWKAAIGSTTLDAGEGNELRNSRAACIAGPCPFTQIESTHPSDDNRVISVSARDWSDTATFLIEAEVFHPMDSDVISDSYPVIFDKSLNFTVPAEAEGVSVQAEISGTSIVFPLGPNLFLSWASCNTRVNKNQTILYRCELKPGFRFRPR